MVAVPHKNIAIQGLRRLYSYLRNLGDHWLLTQDVRGSLASTLASMICQCQEICKYVAGGFIEGKALQSIVENLGRTCDPRMGFRGPRVQIPPSRSVMKEPQPLTVVAAL